MAQDITGTSFWQKIPFIRHYALLARWDRPIGFWLLFWPCVWGAGLAPHFAEWPFQNRVGLIGMLLTGAIIMRGAGCTLNDLFDRKLDAQVARTQKRPLASGAVKPWQALVFLLLQLVTGAAILFQLPPTAVIIGCCTLPVIAIYPLMKRFVWWPQFVLSVIFACGALLGWAAVENALGWQALLLYAAAICWVVAYDTVYAHMDTVDDSLVGIKSTALWWGLYSKTIVGWLWVAAFMLFAAALMATQASWVSWLTWSLAFTIEMIAHAFWPVEKTAYSLRFFRLQHPIGLLLALAALAPVLF